MAQYTGLLVCRFNVSLSKLYCWAIMRLGRVRIPITAATHCYYFSSSMIRNVNALNVGVRSDVWAQYGEVRSRRIASPISSARLPSIHFIASAGSWVKNAPPMRTHTNTPLYVFGTTIRLRGLVSRQHHVNRKSFVISSRPVSTSTTVAFTRTCFESC